MAVQANMKCQVLWKSIRTQTFRNIMNKIGVQGVRNQCPLKEHFPGVCGTEKAGTKVEGGSV